MSLVGGGSVARHLAQGAVTADSSDNVGAGAGLCQSPAGGLTQPMDGRAGGEASVTALAREPSCEAGRLEWGPVLHCQEGQVVSRRSLKHGLQLRVHRDHELGPGLTLAHVHQAITYMLAAHLDYVRAPLRGVE